MSAVRLMIVEDEALVALDLKSRLEDLGYVVVAQTADGSDALMQARQTAPDLVLMDIRLGTGTDGIETAEALRTELALPVVFVTAHSDDATLHRAKVTEPCAYVLKPFRDRDLQVAIEIALHKNRADLERAHATLQARAAELESGTIRLRHLASELTLAEQRAREQLAKTLHDHLQQLLFSSQMKLERGSARIAAGESGTTLLDSARQDLDEAIAATRSLAVELFPPMLHESGLPAALTWLVGWAHQKYALTVKLTTDARANPQRRDVRTLVFESVRELLFNVVKHASVDSVAVDLARKGKDAISITVADNGAGFDPAAIFEPERGPAGGLGLFGIRERLALLGGCLDVSSAPGHGARFTLTAPLMAPRFAGDGLPSVSTAARTSSDYRDRRGRRPLTIVIADDHASVREGLRALFADHRDLQVVGEAADGNDAIAQARALRPDVIVMDVSMPQMDGLEATKRIRAELPWVQVFGLSTVESPPGLHKIEQAGAAGYFTKGGDMHRLQERLLALHAIVSGVGKPASN